MFLVIDLLILFVISNSNGIFIMTNLVALVDYFDFRKDRVIKPLTSTLLGNVFYLGLFLLYIVIVCGLFKIPFFSNYKSEIPYIMIFSFYLWTIVNYPFIVSMGNKLNKNKPISDSDNSLVAFCLFVNSLSILLGFVFISGFSIYLIVSFKVLSIFFGLLGFTILSCVIRDDYSKRFKNTN